MRFLVVLLIVASVGCSNRTKRAETKLPTEVISSDNAQAQREFEQIVADLEAGELSEQTDRLRTFQSTYANDPLATVAELYIGRTLVGDGGSGTQILQGLSNDTTVDARVRWAAMTYAALSLAQAGEAERAMESLSDYPGPSLSPLVLQRDRAAVWALVAESFDRSSRNSDALVALGALWSVGEANTFAVARGFEVAPRLDDAQLEDLTKHQSSEFLRAVSGAVLLDRELRSETSRRERRALQQVLERLQPDLVKIGAEDRVATLKARIAVFGPAQKITIGLVLPLSGPNMRVGEMTLEAALLAVDAFGDHRNNITLLVKDSAEDEASIFKYFEDHRASVVVGLFNGARALAMGEMAANYQIPLLALANDATTEWSSSFYVNALDEAREIARASYAKGDRTFAVVVPNVGYGATTGKAFAEEIEKLGGTVVLNTEYARSSTDFSKIASAVQSAKVDAVFIPDTGAKVAEISSFFAHAGMWGYRHGATPDPKRQSIHYLGTSLWYGKWFLRQSAKYVDGALLPVWTAREFEDAATTEFYDAIDTKLGREPNVIDAFVYDAIKYGVALAALDPSPAKVNEAIRRTPYTGVTGKTSWTSGALRTEVRFVEFVRGRFRPVTAE